MRHYNLINEIKDEYHLRNLEKNAIFKKRVNKKMNIHLKNL